MKLTMLNATAKPTPKHNPNKKSWIAFCMVTRLHARARPHSHARCECDGSHHACCHDSQTCPDAACECHARSAHDPAAHRQHEHRETPLPAPHAQHDDPAHKCGRHDWSVASSLLSLAHSAPSAPVRRCCDHDPDCADDDSHTGCLP